MSSEAILKWSTIISNICQVMLLVIAALAFCFTVGQLNDAEESDKRKATLDHIFKLSDSFDKNTRPATRIVTFKNKEGMILNELVKKIVMSQSFSMKAFGEVMKPEDVEKLENAISSFMTITHDKIVTAAASNEIRFSIVKYLNAWDSMILAARRETASCDLLFEEYIKPFASEAYFNDLIYFSDIYEGNPIEKKYVSLTKYRWLRHALSRRPAPSWSNINNLFKYKENGTLLQFCKLNQKNSGWLASWLPWVS